MNSNTLHVDAPVGVTARCQGATALESNAQPTTSIFARRASVADIGSGAGIPGIPLAITLPASQFSLIEPRRARVAFLEAVVDDLRLSNVAVLPARAEDLGGRFQVCVARAFSSAPVSWKAAERLLAPGGILVYWGGESFDPAVLAEEGVPWRLSPHSDLARTGPLVIMGPQ